MKKIRPIKKGWYDWFISYILESIRKSVGKIVILFKTNAPKQTVYGRKKKLSKPKTQNKINNIRNSFILKKKKRNDMIIRNIWTLFKAEEEQKRKKDVREKK